MTAAVGAPDISQHCDLYTYWNAARKSRPAPTRSDIDPLEMIRFLPFVGLVERRAEGYFWRLMGTAIVEHFGNDFTGQRYGDHVSPRAFVAATTATFDAVLEQKTPYFDECTYQSAKGFQHVVSRLVCPLVADQHHCPMVIHTRLYHYSRELLLLPNLPHQAWGEVLHRWPISSLDEVRQRTEDWRSHHLAVEAAINR